MPDKTEERIKILTLSRDEETLIPLIKQAFEGEKVIYEIRSRYDSAYDGLFIGQKGLADIYLMKKDEEKGRLILAALLLRDDLFPG